MRSGPPVDGYDSGIEVVDPLDGHAHDRESLLADASRLGFELVVRVTETDQVVWEWRRGDGPRPQFVNERVALHWIHQGCNAMRTRRALTGDAPR